MAPPKVKLDPSKIKPKIRGASNSRSVAPEGSPSTTAPESTNTLTGAGVSETESTRSLGSDTMVNVGSDPLMKQDVDNPAEMKVGELVWKNVTLKPEDFVSHGTWMDGNRVISLMYKYLPTGTKFFEDCLEVRARNLPIYPFAEKKTGKKVISV